MSTRRRATFGIACGAVGALATVLVGGLVLLLSPGPNSVSGSCEGASVEVTLAHGPGDASALITGQAAVYDAEGRQWEIQWPGYGAGDVVTAQDYHSNMAFVSHQLGDTDDGNERRVRLRPVGIDDWCRLTGTTG